MRNSKAALRLLCAGCLVYTAGCSYLSIPHLQFFSALLSPGSGTVHIERGSKKLRGEFGISFASGKRNDSATINNNSSFNLQTCRTDWDRPNCFVRFPDRTINVHGIILGEKLVCGTMNVQVGKINNNLVYSGSAGIGARLYKSPVAGRVLMSVGTMNLSAEADIFERSEDGDYLMHDTYVDRKPFIELTTAINTTRADWVINPSLNLRARYFSLFSYSVVRIEMFELSAIGGIFHNFGPVTLFAGGQLTRYAFELHTGTHPRLLTQATVTLGRD